jgi:hypothetical protein
LNELTQNNKQFEWGASQEMAFITIKKAFLKTPVLMMLDLTKPFVIKADASK